MLINFWKTFLSLSHSPSLYLHFHTNTSKCVAPLLKLFVWPRTNEVWVFSHLFMPLLFSILQPLLSFGVFPFPPLRDGTGFEVVHFSKLSRFKICVTCHAGFKPFRPNPQEDQFQREIWIKLSSLGCIFLKISEGKLKLNNQDKNYSINYIILQNVCNFKGVSRRI